MSRNKGFRQFSERSSVGRRLSSRFVAGMTVAEALAATAEVNRDGISVSLDSLGESVLDEAQAQHSAAIYHQLLDEIEARKLNANVSVKLTQMGMEFDPALAERIVASMVEHAERANTFVRIDMEGSEYTEATIAMTERLNQRFPGRVGTVLQAYLFRTANDAKRLVEQGIRIRLCKGAYKEPAQIAFPVKADVDRNYVEVMLNLAQSGVFCGMATHDEAIIAQMCQAVEQGRVTKSAFEFTDVVRHPARSSKEAGRRGVRDPRLYPIRN